MVSVLSAPDTVNEGLAPEFVTVVAESVEELTVSVPEFKIVVADRLPETASWPVVPTFSSLLFVIVPVLLIVPVTVIEPSLEIAEVNEFDLFEALVENVALFPVPTCRRPAAPLTVES